MGLVNGTVVLKNSRLPEVDPVQVEALADSGALHLCIPEHVRIQLLNASPLIVLAKSGRLDLLLGRARELLLPEAVAREVCAAPEDDSARLTLEARFAGSAQVVQVDADALEQGLGNGESAVLNLARARRAIAVVDDQDARRAARALGVSTIGTLGVVLSARRDGRIVSAAEVFRDLRRAALWFKDALIGDVLKDAFGEQWEP